MDFEVLLLAVMSIATEAAITAYAMLQLKKLEQKISKEIENMKALIERLRRATTKVEVEEKDEKEEEAQELDDDEDYGLLGGLRKAKGAKKKM